MIKTEKNQKVKSIAEAILQISPEKHAELIYKYGLIQLESISRPGTLYYSRLENNPKFWSWFELEWYSTMEECLNMLGFDLNNQDIKVNSLHKAAFVEAFKEKKSMLQYRYPSKVITR
jgi:hypothetical protein